MNNNFKKKLTFKTGLVLFGVIAIFLGVTYAFVGNLLTGEKQLVINAGVLDLVLEEENEITISDALPMYDEVGMIQEDVFEFRLVNKTSNPTNYILKLQEIETGTLDKSIVKYGLIKNGEKRIDFVSNIVGGVIDEGTIAGSDTIDYELRLWIDSSVTEITRVQKKFLSFKMGASAAQDIEVVDQNSESVLDWELSDGVLDTIRIVDLNPEHSDDDEYYMKISNGSLDESIIGKNLQVTINNNLLNCGNNCFLDLVLDEEFLNSYLVYDQKTGALILGNMLVLVTEKFTNNGVTLTPGIWILGQYDESVSSSVLPAVLKIKINGSETVTFAGVTKDVNFAVTRTFNYTNEGKYSIDDSGEENLDELYVSNGIYQVEDDDGPSYFYRGQVDNLVKFGEYTKDYYVYRYTSGGKTYDFVSLDACKFSYDDCSDANKFLKYNAGTPMYWRIIRVNGDHTLRMIYAGTSVSATGVDAGIGLSRYNNEFNELNYLGYTYNRTTTEVNSAIKNELDNWYQKVFVNTKYDSQIATSRFCSDTSDYSSVVIQNTNLYAFASLKRNFPIMLNIATDSKPTFKCPQTNQNYGGSYLLKIGLISLDEVVAVGGQSVANNSYYLYNGYDYWTMTPGLASFGISYVDVNGFASKSSSVDNQYLIRPVINLRADVVFKTGTDGSKSTPYEVE